MKETTRPPIPAEASDASPRVLALARFRAANWDRIPLELTRYASFKIQRLRWRTAQGLPRGVFAQDLAQAAIQKTLAGIIGGSDRGPVRGLRNWDPEREPELLDHLKAVVDSDIHSLVTLEEHQLTDYRAELSPDDAAEALSFRLEQEVAARDPGENPEARLLRRESRRTREGRQELLLERLRASCASDPAELRLLQAYLELGDDSAGTPKPAAAARRAGLTDSEARNTRRRIERKARMALEALEANDAGSVLAPTSSRKRECAHA